MRPRSVGLIPTGRCRAQTENMLIYSTRGTMAARPHGLQDKRGPVDSCKHHFYDMEVTYAAIYPMQTCLDGAVPLPGYDDGKWQAEYRGIPDAVDDVPPGEP